LYEYDIFISLYLIRTWPCFLFWRYGVAEIKFCLSLLSLALHVCFRPCWSDVRPQAALGCREHADSICTHARRAGLVRRARLCSSSSCASHDGSRGAEIGIIWAGHQHGHRGNWRQQGCGNLTFVVSSCSVCIWCDVVVACCVCVCMFLTPLAEVTP